MVITGKAPSSAYLRAAPNFQASKRYSNALFTVVPDFNLQPKLTSTNHLDQLSSYRKMHQSFGAMVALVATAAAKTIVITAGAGGFVFSPDTVTADVGDILEYHFVGAIHTAAQGDFSSPCAQSSTGFDSGPVTSVSSSSHL
jgi:plastocyanin